MEGSRLHQVEISTSETPRKRRRIETFNDENDEDNLEATPQRRRPPLQPHNLPPSSHHPLVVPLAPPPQVAAIASKIEEKLAEIEIETRRDIDQLFNHFYIKIRQSIAAAASNPPKPSS